MEILYKFINITKKFGLKETISWGSDWFYFYILSSLFSTIFFKIKAYFYNIKLGKGIKCYGNIELFKYPGSYISIGDNVTIVSNSKRCTASSLFAKTKIRTHSPSAQIIIESGVGLNGTSITARSKKIIIGSGTMIAPNVIIVDSDFHALWPADVRLTNPGFENDRDVVIGKNVWIGMNSLILKGVTIGDNSIVGAGSVVTKDIPPNCIAAGVPAKIIRKNCRV